MKYPWALCISHAMEVELWIFSIILVVLSNTDVSIGEEHDDWSYHDPNGPSTWSQRYPKCNGSHQSPIDIKHEDTIFDTALPFTNIHLDASVAAKLLNNGKTIRASFQSENSTIQGRPLAENIYRAFQVQFHWGRENYRGSEHLFNGKSSAMEIHIVYYNAKKYTNASLAMTKQDGLVVTSVMVEVAVTTNPAVEAVVNSLGKLTFDGNETSIPSLPLVSFLPHEPSRFYHYSGSLTTPGCFQSVKWFVFKNKMQISQSQIDAFRNLYEVGPLALKKVKLVNNFRPVQPLNKRIVTRSFDDLHPQCGKLEEYSLADCSHLAGDKYVVYTVAINPCARPVAVTLSVAVPDINFDHEQIYVSDMDTFQIGNLDYGLKMELHSHPDGERAGQLHLYLYLKHPWQAESSKSIVFNKFFKIDGASKCKKQTAKCTSDSWDKQWCEKTKLGYDNDTFPVAYQLRAQDVCGNPSVSVKFYHKFLSQHWIWSFVHTFTDGDKVTVDFTRHILHGSPERVSSEQTRNRRDISKSRWSHMDFQAKIKKSNNKVEFLLMLTPKGLSYGVVHTVFTYDADVCEKTSGKSSQATKIAIGVTVALVLVAIIGLTVGCLYYKRRNYFGHRQALVEEVDIHDSSITDNVL